MTNVSKSTKLVIAFALIYFIWGTTYLAMRIGLESFPPMLLGSIRFIIAGFGTYFVLRLYGVPAPTVKQWRAAGIAGMLLFIGGNGMVMLAMKQGLPSGIAAVVVATMPIWMTVFEWWLFKGTRPTVAIVSGLFIGFAGIVLLIDPFKAFSNSNSINIVALLLCLMAPIFWSFGSLLIRGMELPKNVFMSVAVQMIWGGLVFAIISLSIGEAQAFEIAKVSLRSVFSVVYLIIFGSILTLSTYMWLLQNAPASRVATYTYVNPVIAVFLGWLVLGELISLKMWIAIGMILAAVVMIVSSQTKHKHDDASPDDSALTPADASEKVTMADSENAKPANKQEVSLSAKL